MTSLVRKHSVIVFPSAAFKVSVLIKFFIKKFFFSLIQKVMKLYCVSQYALYISTITNPNHNGPKDRQYFYLLLQEFLIF